MTGSQTQEHARKLLHALTQRTAAERTRTFEHNGVKVILTAAKCNPTCYVGKFAGNFKRKGISGRIDQFSIGIDLVDDALVQSIAQPRRADHKDITTPQKWAAYAALRVALLQLENES